jgi:hypothetical protein
MNSVDVLKKERAALFDRIKAVDRAIKVLGGWNSSGGKTTGGGGITDAKRRKISIALKKSWAARKAKEKK